MNKHTRTLKEHGSPASKLQGSLAPIYYLPHITGMPSENQRGDMPAKTTQPNPSPGLLDGILYSLCEHVVPRTSRGSEMGSWGHIQEIWGGGSGLRRKYK